MAKRFNLKVKQGKPSVRVKPHSHQPSKAELEEDVRIPTTPEELAQCVMQDVEIEESNEVDA